MSDDDNTPQNTPASDDMPGQAEAREASLNQPDEHQMTPGQAAAIEDSKTQTDDAQKDVEPVPFSYGPGTDIA